MTTAKSNNELLPHLFRNEYSKMTAVLCRHFGLHHIEIAEDIVSDTFLKATEIWPIHGLPENPAAWLYTVAKNKAKDYLKHTAVFESNVKRGIKPEQIAAEQSFEFNAENIADSQLAMIFAVCNQGNATEAQICLALQILCGFSVEEIANAFLAKPATIKKRLQRARNNLRGDNFKIKSLSKADISLRLDTVLTTLYLLFSEGYFSRTANQLIRRELCSEAVRLTLILTENDFTNTTQVNALLSLMCFQSSRLEARTNSSGEAVLFDEQNRDLWDKTLIEKGNYYLVAACKGNEVSKYHLEASIAYWHSAPAAPNKWEHILQLYNQLIVIEYSPVTAMNRAFAYAKVFGHESAIPEAEKLNLQDNSYYHGLLGHLYADENTHKAIAHYKQAIKLTKSSGEQQTLAKEVERLTSQIVPAQSNQPAKNRTLPVRKRTSH